MRVAAVQLTSNADKARNLASADGFAAAAAADGAELIVLPEMFNVLGDADTLRAGAEPVGGPSLQWACGFARERGVWLLAGSIIEAIPAQPRHYNTSCLFDPNGERRALYRKIHLFDCELADAADQESRLLLPGSEAVIAPVGHVKLGLSICYDLRFPELFRVLTLLGARVVVLPSAFTERTGRDHWDPLVRARAIENQLFLIAANQLGTPTPKMRKYGRSMIVDPWGVVLVQAGDQEMYITARLDFAYQDAVRAQLPCLHHRRPETYVWPEA